MEDFLWRQILWRRAQLREQGSCGGRGWGSYKGCSHPAPWMFLSQKLCTGEDRCVYLETF